MSPSLVKTVRISISLLRFFASLYDNLCLSTINLSCSLSLMLHTA